METFHHRPSWARSIMLVVMLMLVIMHTDVGRQADVDDHANDDDDDGLVIDE